jgi:hypothetical protein
MERVTHRSAVGPVSAEAREATRRVPKVGMRWQIRVPEEGAVGAELAEEMVHQDTS